VHPLEGDAFALQSHHGAFLCAENARGGDVVANRAVASKWETFRFTTLESDERGAKGYFQSCDSSCLAIKQDPHTHFTANARDKEDAAVFELINLQLCSTQNL
jgi:hypothetical protein